VSGLDGSVVIVEAVSVIIVAIFVGSEIAVTDRGR
jgi:hypothetical protein